MRAGVPQHCSETTPSHNKWAFSDMRPPGAQHCSETALDLTPSPDMREALAQNCSDEAFLFAPPPCSCPAPAVTVVNLSSPVVVDPGQIVDVTADI